MPGQVCLQSSLSLEEYKNIEADRKHAQEQIKFYHLIGDTLRISVIAGIALLILKNR